MSKFTAIILAAGQGRRMKSDIAKQYLLLNKKPVLFYAIQAFEQSHVDEIILVVPEGEEEYVRETILEPNSFKKVKQLVVGGKERYDSVYSGLGVAQGADYVLIHDGARPLITPEVINQTIQTVCDTKACVVGVPVKDTIKIVNSEGIVVDTPAREYVWSIQTPQAFSFELIDKAYNQFMQLTEKSVTDDAMVLEQMLSYPIKIVHGSYENIKITTPEDISIAEGILRQRK